MNEVQTPQNNNCRRIKVFSYLGKRFVPFGYFKNGSYNKIAEKLKSIGISGYQGDALSRYPAQTPYRMHGAYSYENFYAAAKEAGADQAELFLMDDLLVIPGQNELFQYQGETSKVSLITK